MIIKTFILRIETTRLKDVKCSNVNVQASPVTYTEKVKIIQAKVYNINKIYRKSIDNLTLQNMLVQSTFKNFYI